jgi:hypothetical protein
MVTKPDTNAVSGYHSRNNVSRYSSRFHGIRRIPWQSLARLLTQRSQKSTCPFDSSSFSEFSLALEGRCNWGVHLWRHVNYTQLRLGWLGCCCHRLVNGGYQHLQYLQDDHSIFDRDDVPPVLMRRPESLHLRRALIARTQSDFINSVLLRDHLAVLEKPAS